MDFFSNRTFRERSCTAPAASPITNFSRTRVADVHLRRRSRTGTAGGFCERRSDGVSEPRGNPVTTPMPLLKAAIVELTEHWPATVPFDELLAASCRRLGSTPPITSGQCSAGRFSWP